MKHYQIENTVSGIILGTYEGATEAEALDAMARDAGYRDYRETQIIAPALASEIKVAEVEAAA